MNNRYNILETIRQGSIGGGESHLLSLVSNLNKVRYTPIVLSFTDGPMVDELKRNGVKVKVINSLRPFDIFVWREVKDFIRQNKIDLIHVHGGRAYSNVFWAGKNLGIPMIQTIHGWSFNDNQPWITRKIRSLGEYYLSQKSKINICVSESNRLTGKRYFNNFDCQVILNGIDLQKFSPLRTVKNIRSELNISQQVILLGFIARFAKEKQPLLPLLTFKKALTRNSNLRLLMVGDGELKEQAVNLANQLNISSSVIFLPFRKDIPDILSAIDIFLMTSMWEGLPIGLLEAMSMGKAIIASKVDGIVDIIQDQYNGVLIDLEHIEYRMAEAILSLVENENMRSQLGENAKATVSQKYSASRMAQNIESLYDVVLSSNA